MEAAIHELGLKRYLFFFNNSYPRMDEAICQKFVWKFTIFVKYAWNAINAIW